jgi:hypothetical protein
MKDFCARACVGVDYDQVLEEIAQIAYVGHTMILEAFTTVFKDDKFMPLLKVLEEGLQPQKLDESSGEVLGI